ncbi:MAG: molybdopterin-guanine dinucleotide biosynthesis protein B [Bacillota bacterium]|uniref:molybdopterin-guanine dinucleotide biosynthesis protein B n=1 Tax=Virgibacillus sp. AGTR TaxID=2812055 RepID=UPI00196541EF|nr:molybdopterin-guanine dinucleotide biosynthesis protein B [Virgibacillus sp. AGTR]MCC2249376.1 molybdopterin-guanine dinucleotide biosynthesis protein B [Virgibacillus sp. AGTR]QRZ18828.1 molybdopterin-guanine dinucleotide biosynthesis protein B [Virgibacillus sp. AGTR]
MKIIQVVGYKNSGKTTLVSRMIKTFSKQGFRVASLKHHGHGGYPLGMENKDSEKHVKAGAIISGVEGDGMLQLSYQNPVYVDQIVKIYQMMGIELLIIEGYKQANYSKIVFIRSEQDLHLLDQMTNIQAVITSLPLQQRSDPYPIFNHIEAFMSWLLNNFD